MATTFAPPPQALTQEAAYNLNDDDILMDYEDEVPAATTNAPTASAVGGEVMNGGEMMNVEVANGNFGDEQILAEKIHLRGVDNMSTDNVKAFASEHFKEAAVVKVEWIDDTSCNLIYATPELALQALHAFQTQSGKLPLLALRTSKPAPSHPDSHLQVRLAKLTDRKEKGARERSRYYLFHPEDDIGEQRERLRRERPRSDHRRYNHYEDDNREHGYERRYYDSSEHSRRRERNVYNEDFYNEEPSATRSRRSESEYSRERSYSPDRKRRREGRDQPIELFPDISRRDRELDRDRAREPKELFPSRGESSRFRSERSASPERTPRIERKRSPLRKLVELFPERAERKTRGLEERIRIKGRTLEERISLGENEDTTGMGIRIKGRGSPRKDGEGDDLFAEKLRADKGMGLLSEEGLGRSLRRRGRRNRAEDMFT
ncbi:hypothetical protein RUND412_007714 [Rhizina undulata]